MQNPDKSKLARAIERKRQEVTPQKEFDNINRWRHTADHLKQIGEEVRNSYNHKETEKIINCYAELARHNLAFEQINRGEKQRKKDYKAKLVQQRANQTIALEDSFKKVCEQLPTLSRFTFEELKQMIL